MIIIIISITSTLILDAINNAVQFLTKNDFMMLLMQPVKQKALHWQPLEGLPG